MLLFQKKYIGNYFRAISEIILQKVLCAGKLSRVHKNEPRLILRTHKCVKSIFPMSWFQLYFSVFDSFKGMTDSLLYFVWTIEGGCVIVQHFMAWKWNIQSDWCVLSSWLQHILTTTGVHRPGLFSSGKKRQLGGCISHLQKRLLPEFTCRSQIFYSKHLQHNLINYCTRLSFHNSIRIIYFLVQKVWLKILLPPKMIQFFPVHLLFSPETTSQDFSSLPNFPFSLTWTMISLKEPSAFYWRRSANLHIPSQDIAVRLADWFDWNLNQWCGRKH